MQLQVLDGTQCTVEDVAAAMSLVRFGLREMSTLTDGLSRPTQIVQSLNEWISGSFVDFTTLDIVSISHYWRIQSHFTAVVNAFKEENPDGWKTFVKDVYALS